MTTSADKVLTFGDRELDQDQCATLTFKLFQHETYDLDSTLQKWRGMINDDSFPRNDLIFLLLHFFEHLLPKEGMKELDLVLILLKKELEHA